MGRPALIACGALLLILGAMLAAIIAFAGAKAAPGVTLAIIGVPTALGGVLLLLGFRYPYPDSFRSRVTRIADPRRIIIGFAMIIVSAGLIYLFENAEGILGVLTLAVPDAVMIGALLGMPVGVLTAASFLRIACLRCRVPLAEARLEDPGSEAPAELSFCDRCNRVAVVHRGKATPQLVTDADAQRLLARVPRDA